MAPPARSPIPSSSHPSSHAHHHHHHHTATGQVGHPAAVAAANAHAQGASASAAANANASEDDDGKGELLKGLLDVWWSDDEVRLSVRCLPLFSLSGVCRPLLSRGGRVEVGVEVGLRARVGRANDSNNSTARRRWRLALNDPSLSG